MDSLKLILSIICIVIILAGLYVGYIYKNGKYKKFANKILLNLVCEAELEFGGKTGAIKNSYVFRTIYESMPSTFRIFVSQNEVLDMIETALDEFKKYLTENSEAAFNLGLTNYNTEYKTSEDPEDEDNG